MAPRDISASVYLCLRFCVCVSAPSYLESTLNFCVISTAFLEPTTRTQLFLNPPPLAESCNMPSSTKKRTTGKRQPQQQQPSIPLPPASAPIATTPSQNTASTSAQPINSNTPVHTFDFSFFIKNANGTDVLQFLDAVSQTKEAQNLKLLFMRTVSKGKKLGYHEGEGVGYEQGYKKGKEDCLHDLDVDAAYTAAFEEGHHKGEENKKWLWETLRHTYDRRCMSQQLTPEMISIGVQLQLPYVPPMVSSSTQTSPPSLVNIDMQTSVATDSLPPVLLVSHLDWVEDVTSLPIAPLFPTPSVPCQRAPRDFSGLHSSGLNLFGSLQCRFKQFRAWVSSRFHQDIPFSRSLHSRYQPPPVCPLSSLSKPQVLCQASKNEPLVSSPSVLDWDQDPRLSDLSQALKALGWIHP